MTGWLIGSRSRARSPRLALRWKGHLAGIFGSLSLLAWASGAHAYCPQSPFRVRSQTVSEAYFSTFKSDRMQECARDIRERTVFVGDGRYAQEPYLFGFNCNGIVFRYSGSPHYMDSLIDRNGVEFKVGSSRDSVDQRDEHFQGGCAAIIESHYSVILPDGSRIKATGVVTTRYLYDLPSL